jgi:hypothetical protein
VALGKKRKRGAPICLLAFSELLAQYNFIIVMGWRFRKTFGRGPFRWTLSKRGIGGSWGIPGLRFGISPSGQRYFSVGIHGTGLYYIKYFPTQSQPVQPTSPPANPNIPVLPNTNLPPPAQNPPPPNQPAWWKQKNL